MHCIAEIWINTNRKKSILIDKRILKYKYTEERNHQSTLRKDFALHRKWKKPNEKQRKLSETDLNISLHKYSYLQSSDPISQSLNRLHNKLTTRDKTVTKRWFSPVNASFTVVSCSFSNSSIWMHFFAFWTAFKPYYQKASFHLTYITGLNFLFKILLSFDVRAPDIF